MNFVDFSCETFWAQNALIPPKLYSATRANISPSLLNSRKVSIYTKNVGSSPQPEKKDIQDFENFPEQFKNVMNIRIVHIEAY